MKRIKSQKVMSKVKIFGVNYELNITYKYIKTPKLNVQEKTIQIMLPYKYKKVKNMFPKERKIL